PQQTLDLRFTPATAKQLLASAGNHSINPGDASFAVIYSYGGFTGATTFVRSDDATSAPIHITRAAVPSSKGEAFFKNPFADLDQARNAPLVIQRALIGEVPGEGHGWLIAVLLYVFMAFYAVGPGVCVWLALSELMPTRIRSNGMSIALVINQLVSTTLAVIFLPVASKYGYSAMFFLFAGFTVIYFITAVFFLPETKGKTLEEIEAHFAKS
ncbi:MAG: MFS transporter, partial [Acidobacteriaceae bacterium]